VLRAAYMVVLVVQMTGAMALTFARDPLGAGLNSTVTNSFSY